MLPLASARVVLIAAPVAVFKQFFAVFGAFHK